MKRASLTSYSSENKRARILQRSLSNPVQHFCQSSDLFGEIPLELKYRILTYLSVGDLLSLLRASHAARFLVHLYVRSGLCVQLHEFYAPHALITGVDTTTPTTLKRASEKYQQIGEDPDSELTIRLFLRRVFLDPLVLAYPFNRSTRSNLAVRIAQSLSSNSNPKAGDASMYDFHKLSDNDDQSLTSDQPSDWKNTASTVKSIFVNPEELSSVCRSTSSIPHSLSSDKLPSSAPLVTGISGNQPSTSIPTATGKFWPVAEQLLRILQSFPPKQQARILFILYGPLHRGKLMWRTMCENTAADSEQLSACFGELGSVMQLMIDSEAWSSDQALDILDEVIATPDDWLAENVACLLYTSGLRLASMVVTKRAVSGQIGDLALTLTSLCLVRVKIRASLTDLVGLVGDACRASEHTNRRQFLDHLARAFQDVIVDLYETDDLEDRIEDFSTILRAQAEFMRVLMARVYEQ
ncbi:unnamed protein product [Echinostoma caproni]|uniref:F-box domain-containing protein n=1 Tax=Echinostoma caproni TaxID=27848 RepID=A0A183ARX3_9TREM|nr:unnamed protein product [Echinostoma caproni]